MTHQSVNEAGWVPGDCGQVESVCLGSTLQDLLTSQEKLEIQTFYKKPGF